MKISNYWTMDKLLDWFKDRGRGINEFCGAECQTCKRTANVPEMAGWRCACGAWNLLGFPGWNKHMHETPDQGPKLDLVAEAMKRNGLC